MGVGGDRLREKPPPDERKKREASAAVLHRSPSCFLLQGPTQPRGLLPTGSVCPGDRGARASPGAAEASASGYDIYFRVGLPFIYCLLSPIMVFCCTLRPELSETRVKLQGEMKVNTLRGYTGGS